MLRRWPCIHAQTFDRSVVSTPLMHSNRGNRLELTIKARTSLVINYTNPFYLEGCVIKSLCFAKRDRNLVLFLWSSCHCGCQREGRISKGTGGFPVSSLATLVKTEKKRYLEDDDLIPHTTLLQYEKTLAYNITLQILLSSVLSRLSSSPDRLVFLNTVTLLCLIQFFQTHSEHRIYYPC